MELRCPNCGTRFRVDAELLREQGSVVRCSMCNTRFRAYPDPDQPPELIERGDSQAEPSPAPEPLTEERFEAEEEEEGDALPEDEPEHSPSQEIDPDSPPADAGEEAEGDAGEDAGPDDAESEADDEADAEEEPAETARQRKQREKAERKAQKAQEKEQKQAAKAEAKAAKRAAKGGWGRFFVKLLVGMLVLALVAELAYVFRVRLLGYAWPRSVTQQALQRLDLDWQLPVAVTRYRVDGLSAQRVELPSGKQVTVLRGELVNGAEFDQRPPRMAVRALGAGDRVLYRRTLIPGRPFQAEAAGKQGETALDRAWRHAREEFPARFEAGHVQPFQLVLDGVPPGVRRFRLEMVN